MKSHTIAINDNHTEKRIAKIFLWAIAFAIALYACFVIVATFSIAKRSSMESQEKQLVSEINNLELTYLEQSEALDMIYATSIGFHDVAQASFAVTQNVALDAR